MSATALQVPALRVEQPLGVYYVTVLSAKVLLEVAFSDALSASVEAGNASYAVDGTQRLMQPARLQAIADYINREDAAFPNSIILAANYRKEDGFLVVSADGDAQEIERRWSVEENNGSHCTLNIPTKEKLAAIIDGQHRLFAFHRATSERLEMGLICSVFLDLPKPYQAQLFATINSTQKPVNKSLTYELFGYNVESEEEKYWSPDKLAVFLTRKLGRDERSPLKGRIAIAPIPDENLQRLAETESWKVSTAVIVEGIMRLYTSNPKKDTNSLLAGERRERSKIESMRKDASPLRDLYLQTQDSVIYAMVLNYLIACDQLFWEPAKEASYIKKTVGVQALFDVLRKLAQKAYDDRDIRVEYFLDRLQASQGIDFSAEEFKKASGSGRTYIRKRIESLIGL